MAAATRKTAYPTCISRNIRCFLIDAIPVHCFLAHTAHTFGVFTLCVAPTVAIKRVTAANNPSVPPDVPDINAPTRIIGVEHFPWTTNTPPGETNCTITRRLAPRKSTGTTVGYSRLSDQFPFLILATLLLHIPFRIRVTITGIVIPQCTRSILALDFWVHEACNNSPYIPFTLQRTPRLERHQQARFLVEEKVQLKFTKHARGKQRNSSIQIDE